jgi:hypothetical protein
MVQCVGSLAYTQKQYSILLGGVTWMDDSTWLDDVQTGEKDQLPRFIFWWLYCFFKYRNLTTCKLRCPYHTTVSYSTTFTLHTGNDVIYCYYLLTLETMPQQVPSSLLRLFILYSWIRSVALIFLFISVSATLFLMLQIVYLIFHVNVAGINKK